MMSPRFPTAWCPLRLEAQAARRAVGAVLLALLVGLPATPSLAASAPPAPARPSDWIPTPGPAVPVGSLALNPFPILFYTPETRTGIGVGAWVISRNPVSDGNGPPDNIWLSAVYTQERQTIVRAIPELYFSGGALRLKLRLRYQSFPTRFYGIGGHTPDLAEEPYTPVTHAAQATLTRSVFGLVSVGARVAYDHTEVPRVAPGGQLAAGTVPGARGSRLAGMGLVVRRDRREQHFSPHSGSLMQVTVLRYHDLDGAPWRFTETTLDLRKYLSLLTGQVLALQVLAQSIAGPAPFTALPRLGGKFVLRGLYDGRYRDRNLLALQAEHRLHLGGRWGATVFASLGDVAPQARKLALGDLKAGGGAGLRYAYSRRERINIRLDMAFAHNSSGVYFSVGEAY